MLASTAAQAQYTFEYGGRTIRIDPDRGTVSIPGVYDNTGTKAKRSRSEDGDRDRPRKQGAAAGQDRSAGRARRLPLRLRRRRTGRTGRCARSPAPAAPATAATGEPSTATAAVAPADSAAPAPPHPVLKQRRRAAAARACSGCRAAPPSPPQKQAAAPAASTARPSNSPLGVWLTEEKEGKVRIEQCGANLCGYSVDKKSNQNGEQVLINMKPGKDKWSGRILDPNTGSTYDSTIALKGTDTLRVQGCAFGGMFCGGQTWTRVN